MINLAFTGDIAFSKYFKEAYLKENLFSEKILDFLNSADYTIANIEAPITNNAVSMSKALVHVTDPKAIGALLKIKTNVWNLANNHSMDCGESGLNDTINLAQKNNILTIGAGTNLEKASVPLVLRKNGVSIGIVSVCSPIAVIAKTHSAGCVEWDNYSIIKKQIKRVNKECDYCVVVVHGGEEFTSIPLPFARDKYKKYLKFGADIVVGHHPHVPQNYEKIGKKIIFYSLGNFVFDTDYQRIQKNTERGVLIKISFDKEGFKWDSLAIKINREKNIVEDDMQLFIFQNISAKDYKKLLPYVIKEHEFTLRKKLLFLKKIDGNIKKCKFNRIKKKRFKFYERFGFLKGKLIRCKKYSDNNLNEFINYISNE